MDETQKQNKIMRVITGIIISLIALCCLFLGGIPLVAFLLVVIFLGSIEYVTILRTQGFHPSLSLINEFELKTDARGNIAAPTDGECAYRTSCDKVFAAGDGRKGQSLVVYAIAEGRNCAHAVDKYLNH